MQRALFLFALAVPFSPRPSETSSQTQIEIVGPSVLMNRAREAPIALFDLREAGRSVPGATKNLDAAIENAPVFALGEPEIVSQWAQKRALRTVQIVPSHLIEFEAMPGVPQIAPRAAHEKVERENWPLFDISEAFEFDGQRLPRSQRLDFIEFGRGNWQQLPKNRPFIVACRVGHRSQLVTQKLREMGYDARNLNGGLWQWQVEKLPLEGEVR
jgi:rhodanese-related sulfurtransferase